MNQDHSFESFPRATLTFLRGIRRNNKKAWFDEHRSDYDRYYVDVAKSFVSSIAPRLKKLSSGMVAEPKINGSIFRINRDIRISNDKRPYKDHLDFAFWEGEKKQSSSSLFLRISPDGVYIGLGFHKGCPEHERALRAALVDERSSKSLMRIVKRFEKIGSQIEGKHYKRMPRGVDSTGPAAQFLLHNAMFIVKEFKPAVASQPDIQDICLQQWKDHLPLHRWLIDYVR